MIGSWRVAPLRCLLINEAGESRHLEPKVMDTLVCLSTRPGELFTRDELLTSVWGEYAQSDQTLTRAVGELRRAFQDDSRHPHYIETVPKRGYRLVAPVTTTPLAETGNQEMHRTPAVAVDDNGVSLRHVLAFTAIALIAIVGMINVNMRFDRGVTTQPDVKPNSIAVLPFRNHSRRDDDLPFVDGMHDEIISQLGKLTFFEKVISRTSTERFRETNKAAPEIAAELGVTAILEGGVRRAGDRVRVNVTLIDAPSDELIWTEVYERDLTTGNVFDIQDEITLAVAAALQARLSREEQEQLARFPTDNLNAYDAYLRGRQAMMRRTVDALREARNWFDDAIALDPDFALAHVGRADSISIQVLLGGLPETAYAEAETAARRAVELNDQLGEAYASLAFIGWRHARFRLSDFTPVELNFLRAQELAPHYEPAFHWYALLLADMNRRDDAISVMQRAIGLNPLHADLHANLGVLHGGGGDLQAALDSLHRALELDPLFAPAMTDLGELYLFFGEPVEAIRWLRRALSIDPSRQQAIARQVSAYMALGTSDEAAMWYRRLMDSPPTFWQKVYAMIVHFSRGELDAADAVATGWLADNDECTFCLEIALHVRLERGAPVEALEFAERYAPALFDRSATSLEPARLFLIAPVAKALQTTGRQDDARELLAFGLEQCAAIPRLLMGRRGRGIEDVRMYALLDREADAIVAFREALDAGWRFRHPAIEQLYLDTVLQNAEFAALKSRHDTEMAAEYGRLIELEQLGELAAN